MNTIIIPDNLNRRTLKAFFTTKKAGTDSNTISHLTGTSESNMYMPVQKHTDNTHVLRFDPGQKIADAVLTRRKNVLVGVAVADCVPILLYDHVRMVCGAVHAGWRGTANTIIKKTVSIMLKQCYSDPSDILVAIGPAIRWCCYHVGGDVLDAVVSSTGTGDYFEKRDGNICLDLPMANKTQAVNMGVNEENIWMSDECTYCSPHKYYSYRYAKGPTGRQGGFIGMFD